MKIKRFLCILLTAASAVMLSACAPSVEGYVDVKKAKELYEQLDSAHVIMTDNSGGEQMMDFVFYINKKDEMVFYYESLTDGDKAYSDGVQFYYKTGGDGWVAITPANEEYIYNVYNRKYRYPYARGGIFFLDGTSVSLAEIVSEDGVKTVTYVYDCDKLNKNAVEYLDNVSEFSALTCIYTINEDGYITEFTEKGALIDNNGEFTEMDMTISVLEMNSINSVENPVDHIAAE